MIWPPSVCRRARAVRCRPKLGEAIWIVQQDEPRGVTGRSRERGAAMLRVLFCDEARRARGSFLRWCTGGDFERLFQGEEMVRDTGFEPVTPAVSRQCSTTELTAPELRADYARRQRRWQVDDSMTAAAGALESAIR